jgi:hypothetical protein
MKQLSEINDPLYCFTAPYCIYSHDKVPLVLAASTEETIDTRGISNYISFFSDEHK